MDRLKGKVAIVSGGAGGCGAAAVRLFAAEGAAVGIIDRDAGLGAALAAEMVAAGHRVVFAAADVAVRAQVDAAVAQVSAALGPVTVLFNHAGTIVIKRFLDTEGGLGLSVRCERQEHVSDDARRVARHDRGGGWQHRLHVEHLCRLRHPDGGAV